MICILGSKQYWVYMINEIIKCLWRRAHGGIRCWGSLFYGKVPQKPRCGNVYLQFSYKICICQCFKCYFEEKKNPFSLIYQNSNQESYTLFTRGHFKPNRRSPNDFEYVVLFFWKWGSSKPPYLLDRNSPSARLRNINFIGVNSEHSFKTSLTPWIFRTAKYFLYIDRMGYYWHKSNDNENHEWHHNFLWIFY